MLKRLLVFGLWTSLIQVIIFYFFIFIVYWFAAAITHPLDNDPNGDYVVLFSAILLPIMVIVQNVIAAVINKKKATYVLMVIMIAVYMIGLIDIGSSITFKSGLCLVFGLVVLGIKTKIDDRLR
jgi:hypothetical protein